MVKRIPTKIKTVPKKAKPLSNSPKKIKAKIAVKIGSSVNMIHQPMGGTGGGTQQSDMAIAAEHLLKTRQNLEQILADNSGQSLEKVHADAERDNWMSAQETLEYGFIDQIMVNNELN